MTDLQKKAIEIKEAVRKDEDKLVKYIKTQFKLNDKDIIRKTFSLFTDYTIETFLKSDEDREKFNNAKKKDKKNLENEIDKKYKPFLESFTKRCEDLKEERINMSKDPNIGFQVLTIYHIVEISNKNIPAATYLFVINRENVITGDALDDAGFKVDMDGAYRLEGKYPEDLKELGEADGKKN